MKNHAELMVKLNNKKIKYIVDSRIKNKHSAKELSDIYQITERRVQMLIKEFNKTGKYPKLNRKRRPKTELTEEQKDLIEKGYAETFFGAMMLRHHIRTKYKKNVPQNKMHKYMLEKGYAKPNPRKQKKRKRCRYQRDHSLSLLHMDWTSYSGKEVIAVQDDASRKILSLMECKNANTLNSIKVLKKARKELGVLAPFIRAINTDRGPQFYPNKGFVKENHEFLKHLKSLGIKHIPSRVNNPQTNGKLERWFQEYKRHRRKFKSTEEFRVWFNNKIHGALKYRRGETPNKAFMKKINPSIWVGLNFEGIGL